MLSTFLLLVLCVSAVLSWWCWRDLSNIRAELRRHQRGRAIKANVLREAAKLRMEVQP